MLLLSTFILLDPIILTFFLNFLLARLQIFLGILVNLRLMCFYFLSFWNIILFPLFHSWYFSWSLQISRSLKSRRRISVRFLLIHLLLFLFLSFFSKNHQRLFIYFSDLLLFDLLLLFHWLLQSKFFCFLHLQEFLLISNKSLNISWLFFVIFFLFNLSSLRDVALLFVSINLWSEWALL